MMRLWIHIGHTARMHLQVRYISALSWLDKIVAARTTDSATRRIAAYTYRAYTLVDVRSSGALDVRDKTYAAYGIIQRAL